MATEKKADPAHPPVYQGDQDKDQLPFEGPPIRTEPSEDNRGHRAKREGSGVVSGSGADAGGTGGITEDYDEDPIGGGGPTAMPTRQKGG